ncbi:MAG: hypothetical protein KC457_30790 [Myxococcales bacterium]|nr:hypothetical protein [Myxococcales bacterium]
MLSRIVRIALLGFLGLTLAACEGGFGTKDEAVEPATVSSSETGSSSSASASGLGSGSAFTGHPLDNPDSLLSRRTVYFDFDSSEILAEAREIVEAHAQYLAANPGATVTLEGHADERGAGAGLGATINIPLPPGSGDAELLAAYDQILLPAAARFDPQLVLVSAGFDAHVDDPLGGMRVSTAGFAALCERVRDIADRHASGRLLLSLEGGYELGALRECVRACIGVLTRG